MTCHPGVRMPARPRLSPRSDSPRWKSRGACVDRDPELWFSYDSVDKKLAAEICGDCPVRRECRAESILLGEDYGIWGGIDETKRKQIRKGLARGQHFVGMLE